MKEVTSNDDILRPQPQIRSLSWPNAIVSLSDEYKIKHHCRDPEILVKTLQLYKKFGGVLKEQGREGPYIRGWEYFVDWAPLCLLPLKLCTFFSKIKREQS